jgi:membrane protease subunit HflC
MNKAIAVAVGLLLLVLLLLFSTTYTVKYNEVAIKATFGQSDEQSIVREPGLHFRLPIFIDKITKLDTRLQLVESPIEEITTDDDLQLVVRAYLLWRVNEEGDGPLRFFRSYSTIDGATERLPGQFRTAFTGALSQYAFSDLIGENSRLAEVEDQIRLALQAPLADEGIEPVAVGISQIMFPAKTTRRVLTRMQATRDALASAEESKGSAEAHRIEAEAMAKRDKIRAFANQRAEEIRAAGEEQAAEYLREMSQDPELATFLVWLDALEQALSSHTTVVLPTSTAPWHLLVPRDAELTGDIPRPSEADEAMTGVEEGVEAEATAPASDSPSVAERTR